MTAPSAENFIASAKKKALKYANEGKIKEAIDSMILSISGDSGSSEAQKQLIGMMGMELRNKPNLTEIEVKDFINGFTE